MKLKKMLRIAAATILAAWGISPAAQANVTAFFSSTPDCAGSNTVNFAPGGPAVKASLCMTTTNGGTTPASTATCGVTIVLQSAAAESGKFTVTGNTLGATYGDPNSAVSPLPLPINNPPTAADLGGTRGTSTSIAAPVPATPNQLLATFDITPQASATNGTYVVSLAPVSVAAIDQDSGCGTTGLPPTDAPLTATLTLSRAAAAPIITSANNATFKIGVANTFTVTAVGTPTPTYTVSGTLPGGVSFNTTTGVLSGNPAAPAAVYNLTFTATNGNNPPATQNFTLTVSNKTGQTISFTGPSAQTFSTTPIALTATASSGLPVTFSSQSPSICSVSGSNVTMLMAGTCIVAADQAGDATYDAAPQVVQSFGIAGKVPDAPVIGTAINGNGQATISFTPASNGGSPIQNFKVTCTAGASTVVGTGYESPLTVLLTNGLTYSCTVTAENSLGTSLPSAAVTASPSAAVPLALIGVASIKTHGAAGTFGVPIDYTLPITGSVSVEPRSGPNFTIVFSFNGPITAPGTVTMVDQSAAAVGSASLTFSGNQVTVNATGVPNAKRATISLTGVNGTLNASASMAFLNGDIDGGRSVNVLDVIAAKVNSAKPISNQYFRSDLDFNGTINVIDVIAAKVKSGTSAP